MKKWLAITIFSAYTSTVLAQDSAKTHSYFEAALYYQSDNVYLGRKDSTALPYTIPMLTYYHRSGLYISASAAWLKNSIDSRIDLITLEGGYTFSAGHYSGDLTLSKYFYNSQSTSVTSGIREAVSYQNSYNFGPVKAVVKATLNIADKVDLETAFGLEHRFELFDDRLEITPSFTANGGTLNYYNDYYRERKFNKKKGKNAGTGTVAITGTVEDPSYRMLDYEPSCSFTFLTGRWTFTLSPVYAIPVNPSRIDLHYDYSTGITKDKQQVEKISNTLFWTAGATYHF